MDPLSKYKIATATTTGVVRQLIFVFDEIIKLFHLAKKAEEENDYETKFKTLTKVVDVFYNLSAGVKTFNNSDLLGLLDNFYQQIIVKVERVNIVTNDPNDIEQLIKAVSIVRDSIKGSSESKGASNI